MKRYKTVFPPNQPLAYHNVLFTFEPSRGTLFHFCTTFSGRTDATGEKVNPARKSWQTVADFLQQFAYPRGGTILSFLDGLGTVPMACLHHGHSDCIAFEKDPVIFREACRVVTEFKKSIEKKEKTMASRLSRKVDFQQAVAKVRAKGKERLTKEEVFVLPFCNFFV